MEALPEANRNTAVNFGVFHEQWLIRQEELLRELLQWIEKDSAGRPESMEVDDEIRMDLIGRVLAQFREYYEAKSRVKDINVFLLFSASWLNPFERMFLWITGFKPTIVFRIVNNTVTDRREDQSRRMDELEREVRAEEDELTAAMDLVQSSGPVASRMVELAMRLPREAPMNGEVLTEDAAVESLSRCLVVLVERAEGLRGKAVVRVVQILSATQGVRFLVAVMRSQLRLAHWGRHGGGDGPNVGN
ncbi:hypothetical protein SAY86_030914 [Trapa natans]|uniref:DOG1 domain-containing protein n=1 Tax=Trapa natans TaxID=22666 RepID=A0AAN7RIZ6_TRANT|nr:hypothetical protein SAY86_030914 [Trapa natans]